MRVEVHRVPERALRQHACHLKVFGRFLGSRRRSQDGRVHSLRRGFLTSLAPGRAPGLALLLLFRVQLRQPLRSSLGPLPLLLPMGAQPLRDLRPPICTIAVGAVRTAGTAGAAGAVHMPNRVWIAPQCGFTSPGTPHYSICCNFRSRRARALLPLSRRGLPVCAKTKTKSHLARNMQASISRATLTGSGDR